MEQMTMELEGLKQATRQESMVLLYERAFPKVAAFVSRSGGNFDDAKDVFQDALIAFYEKKASGAPDEVTDEPAYVTGIAKHLWYRKLRGQQLFVRMDGQELEEATEPLVSKSLLRFVERSGKKCLELLKGFYYDRLNMQELADRFQFSGERSAAAQKHKCLEKVRDVVRQRGLRKTDFYE